MNQITAHQTSKHNENVSEVSPLALAAYQKAKQLGHHKLTLSELSQEIDGSGATVAHILVCEGYQFKLRQHKEVLKLVDKTGITVKKLQKQIQYENRTKGKVARDMVIDSLIGKSGGQWNPSIMYKKFSTDTSPITRAIPDFKKIALQKVYNSLKNAPSFSNHGELLENWGLIDDKGKPDNARIDKIKKVQLGYLLILVLFFPLMLYSGITGIGTYRGALAAVTSILCLVYMIPFLYRYDTLKNQKHFSLLQWLKFELSIGNK